MIIRDEHIEIAKKVAGRLDLCSSEYYAIGQIVEALATIETKTRIDERKKVISECAEVAGMSLYDSHKDYWVCKQIAKAIRALGEES